MRGHIPRGAAAAACALAAVLALGGQAPLRAQAAAAPPIGAESDEGPGGFYKLVGPDGLELLRLGLRVRLGDMFLSEDNVWYEATAVGGFKVQMRPMPQDRWPLPPAPTASAGVPAAAGAGAAAGAPPVIASALPALALTPPALAFGPRSAPAAAPLMLKGGARIRLYHSHSDESYAPTDGQSNIPERGGIYQVGAVFRDALAARGYSVVQDDTAHDPHDDAAYTRSRRTALKLLQQGANVLFDVHRDTAPAEAYRRTIAGQDVTQVMIVVGRDNPGMQANLGFAKAVKDAADRIHPRLIRGIFMGEGGYNQDLSPRALLFEVGSFANRREEAERGIRLLADVMPSVLGAAPAPAAPGTAAAAPPPHSAERSGLSRALAWLAVLAVVGGGAFLLIAAGGVRPAAERLRLLGREFADLNPRRRKRP
ncbi:MAG: stage II sporulation protein P [Bacillota bacterium]